MASSVVIVMGVCGCGKTTVARALAERLGGRFLEGDDLHPAPNVHKMARGEPLDDADREPWLGAIRREIEAHLKAEGGGTLVLACSALKREYRCRLAGGLDRVRFVYLRADRALAQERVADRKGHYMPAGLVESQFQTLEEPGEGEAQVLDARLPIATLVEKAADGARHAE